MLRTGNNSVVCYRLSIVSCQLPVFHSLFSAVNYNQSQTLRCCVVSCLFSVVHDDLSQTLSHYVFISNMRCLLSIVCICCLLSLLSFTVIESFYCLLSVISRLFLLFVVYHLLSDRAPLCNLLFALCYLPSVVHYIIYCLLSVFFYLLSMIICHRPRTILQVFP